MSIRTCCDGSCYEQSRKSGPALLWLGGPSLLPKPHSGAAQGEARRGTQRFDRIAMTELRQDSRRIEGRVPGSVSRQTRELLKVVRCSPGAKTIFQFCLLITLIIGANAVVQIRLNSWQGNIYDAISRREIPVFLHELLVFAVIVSILLCLGVAQTWLHENLKVRLREAVTGNLLHEWLRPKRAFLLTFAGDTGANPDQRIQDDTKRLSELSADLGVGLVQSSLLALAFVGVLWTLSSQVIFEMHGARFVIPGYMVWCAILYATLGSFFTWLAGRSLIEAHGELRANEAHFRFALMHVNETSEVIGLCGGETTERRLLQARLSTVIGTMRSIASRVARLGWVTGSYGWAGLVVPMILAAPGYFGGTLSLGGMMMVVGAFNQVQQALRWYVDRFPAIAEWRALLERVAGYRKALTGVEAPDPAGGQIFYAQHAEGNLSFVDLCVFGPGGRIELSEPRVEIRPGERVLIFGPAKSGKSIFFRAIAGLWVWGEGAVYLPAREATLILPELPYFPLGTLRAAISYPDDTDRFGDASLSQALERVQLEKLIPALDCVARWDNKLSADEQHRLMLARLLAHRPAWVIHDESMMEMEEETQRLVISIFNEELRHAAVLNFGRGVSNADFFHRSYRLRTVALDRAVPLQSPA